MHRFLSATAIVLTMAFGTAAIASPKPFNIAADDARRSLLEFGRQSELQILFATDEVKGVVLKSC